MPPPTASAGEVRCRARGQQLTSQLDAQPVAGARVTFASAVSPAKVSRSQRDRELRFLDATRGHSVVAAAAAAPVVGELRYAPSAQPLMPAAAAAASLSSVGGFVDDDALAHRAPLYERLLARPPTAEAPSRASVHREEIDTVRLMHLH